jgi:tetratricopeptide (TPR) repeat protein
MSAADEQQLKQAIDAGRTALQSGDMEGGCQHLGGIDHPEALYLLALAKHQLEQPDAAEQAFRRALVLRPGFIQARTALGRLLIELKRWDDAVPVYQQLLQSDPHNTQVRFEHSSVQLGLGNNEEAESNFDALINEGNDLAEIRFMRGRARLELGQISDGLKDLRNAHSREPNNDSLKALASTLWMRGETDAFETVLGQALNNPVLVVAAADMLRQSGKPERAIAAIDAARESQPYPIEASAVLTQAYLDLDDAVAAEKTARVSLTQDPDNPGIKVRLISALLMQGKADAALELIIPMRRSEPNAQHWIAYEATALRLLGDQQYDELVDLDRFVRPYALPVPNGFDSIDAFNRAFLQALDRWYQYEHHPLYQSLRDGSQTSRNLTSIDDPVIGAYIEALDTPIRDYMRFVGASDAHPLTARNTGEYRIAGSWSVRLHGGGRHVNHVHPEGWISSAYYVAVPDEVQDKSGKAGWIKFGEPPFRSTPPTPPEKWVQPSAGMLVLFPSFLWHGTEPINDDSVRVTAPFDVVPA